MRDEALQRAFESLGAVEEQRFFVTLVAESVVAAGVVQRYMPRELRRRVDLVSALTRALPERC